jgi:hypothetical protein
MMPDDQRQQAELLLGLDEEELLYRLAMERAPPRLGAAPPTRKSLIAQANQWLQGQARTIQSTVCTDKRVQTALAAKQPWEDVELSILVMHCVAPAYGAAISGLVATLVVRRGLKALCATFATPDL